MSNIFPREFPWCSLAFFNVKEKMAAPEETDGRAENAENENIALVEPTLRKNSQVTLTLLDQL